MKKGIPIAFNVDMCKNETMKNILFFNGITAISFEIAWKGFKCIDEVYRT